MTKHIYQHPTKTIHVNYLLAGLLERTHWKEPKTPLSEYGIYGFFKAVLRKLRGL